MRGNKNVCEVLPIGKMPEKPEVKAIPHIRTSNEIIGNLLNDYLKLNNLVKYHHVRFCIKINISFIPP